MIKQRIISLYESSKIIFFSRFFFVIGITLILIFLIFTLFSIFTSVADIILAFSILFFVISGYLNFFHQQAILLYRRSKTNFFSRCLLLIGVILVSIFIILTLFTPNKSQAGIVLAFSIIILGVSVVMYFFHRQFAKLEQIAEEIEPEEGDEELSEETE